MIDFKNASYLKMRLVDNSQFAGVITPMLIQDEQIISTTKLFVMVLYSQINEL